MVFRRRRRAKSFPRRRKRRSISRFRRRRRVFRVPTPELKVKERVESKTLSTTPAIFEIFEIGGGPDQSERIGSKCTYRSISLRWDLSMSTLSVDACTIFRLIVFTWNDDTEPLTADVLQVAQTNALVAHSRGGKMRILMDRVMNLRLGEQECASGKFYRKVNWKARYGNVLSTSGRWGRIYFYLMSSVTANLPTFAYCARLRYMDN